MTMDGYDRYSNCKWSNGGRCHRPSTKWVNRIFDKLFSPCYPEISIGKHTIRGYCEDCREYEVK